MGELFLVLMSIFLFVFWLFQIVALMDMKDNEFPGRHDKVLWFIAVLLGSVVGALAFLLWRFMRSGETMSDRLADDIAGLIGKSREEEEDATKNHGSSTADP